MPMQSVFPIRYGLTVPRGENLQATEIFCEGGLDLTQSLLEFKPGYASELVNYEANLKGGYRRISGLAPLFFHEVPGKGDVFGVAVYTPTIFLAARQAASNNSKYNMYIGSSFGWSQVVSNYDYEIGMHVNSTQYNWSGTPTITFTDGVNPAYKYDGSTVTVLDASGSPTDPLWAISFHNYLFLSGYSSNPAAITISAPLDDENYDPVDGAAEFVVGDTKVTGFGMWRADLIIFCTHSIWKITGNSTDIASSTPFKLENITRTIGCIEGRTIQECNGDLIFLAQDGLRTISGTANIGDTEIASISRPIQDIFNNIDITQTPCFSTIVRSKTQYRLFYPDRDATPTTCRGVIASIRKFKDGHEGWEFGELTGFKPTSTDSRYLLDGNEYVIMGSTDGYVYKLEVGSTFSYVKTRTPYLYNNGVLYNSGAIYNNVTYTNTPIGELYTSVPLDLGDYGVRKALQRITTYYQSEGATLNLYLHVKYDYGKQGIIQPKPYQLTLNRSSVRYNRNILYDSGALYNTILDPVKRLSIQGSGFVVQFQFNSVRSDPYVIQGFYLEYFPSGRR